MSLVDKCYEPEWRGSPAGEAEGYRRYILYSDRASKGILLYSELNKGLFSPNVEILLALGFVSARLSSTCMMLKGSARNITRIVRRYLFIFTGLAQLINTRTLHANVCENTLH